MKNLFDYIFYRIAKFYYKWDRGHASTAIIALTSMQWLCVDFVFCSAIRMCYARQETARFLGGPNVVVGIGFFGLLFLNIKKYQDTYPSLREQWKRETRLQKWGRGIGVVAALLLPLGGMLFLAALP